MDSDEAPNAIVRATTQGFQHVNDPAVLAPLVEKYFASLTTLWAERSYHIAETLVVGLYPAPLANAELRDATQAWLDSHTDAAPALRRLVVENLAGVERALAAQAADV
ncbi:Aminopeptidase N [compost metagenome]